MRVGTVGWSTGTNPVCRAGGSQDPWETEAEWKREYEQELGKGEGSDSILGRRKCVQRHRWE